ncbi:MAG: hypothetical protein ACREX4_16930 [Gammaproteobacteria bacterium]
MNQLIEQHLTDSRGKNPQFPLADLLRQSINAGAKIDQEASRKRRSRHCRIKPSK